MATVEQKLSQLIGLQSEAYSIESATELAVYACNRPHDLHRFFQSVSWQKNSLNKIEILAVSGVSMVDPNALAARFIIKLIKIALTFEDCSQAKIITIDDIIDKDFQKEWSEFLPPYFQWLPYSKGDRTEAGLMIFHEEPVTNECQNLFIPLSRTFNQVWHSLPENRKKQYGLLGRFTRSSRNKWIAAFIIFGILCIPVRESSLAPASVVATKPIVVSASINGVVQDIHIPPNAFVKKGDLLVSLDADQLLNDLDVVKKELESAKTEFLIASQRAFNQVDAKADVNLLKSRAEGAELNVQRAQSLLNRSRIYAEQDGLAIYNDKYEFLGQQVSIGKRIMLLADVDAVEIDIYMPVGDTIDYSAGDEVLLFLNTDPTNPIKATLRQTSFEPRSRANGGYAFFLKAKFDSSEFKGRIGWAGTAKVYSSKKISLFMYFFRRPIASLRRVFGI
jgi:multidrug resistance efflux pump